MQRVGLTWAALGLALLGCAGSEAAVEQPVAVGPVAVAPAAAASAEPEPAPAPQPRVEPEPVADTRAPAPMPARAPLTPAEADRLAQRALDLLRELSGRIQSASGDCKRVAAEMTLWANTYGAELQAMARRSKGGSASQLFAHRQQEMQAAMQPFIHVLSKCASDADVRAAIEHLGKVVK